MDKNESKGGKKSASPTKKGAAPQAKKGQPSSPSKQSSVDGGEKGTEIGDVVPPVKSSSSTSSPTTTTPTTVTPTTTTEEKKVEVADENAEDAGATGESWSGWFSSTINSAKEKSNEMLQYLKQDLSEFTETVSEAGRDLKDKLKIEENAMQAVNVVGEKFNVALEQMSTIFGVGPDDEDEEVIVGGNPGRVVVDRVQAKIYSLALDDAVFLNDPEDMDAYEKWLAHFDLEVKNDEIAELLTTNPHLQLHYSQLVPDKVSHLVFWHRFYYRVQLIFDEETKHKEAAEMEKERNKSPQQSSEQQNKTSGNSSGNDSPVGDMGPGGDQSMVEISEEDQKRLLAEYEEELNKGDESGKHSRRSSGTQMSSSSSGSFAFVTRDPDTNELKVD
ncbi:BSD domain-containing protein 1 [Folsomia candida]|uniref:BSD domain-containing protein 1 n=1 Tax=Folsomia candida TaxID=158441 RepID=UPI000B8EF93B|nr:BSD domain-containing protein 1 [Folsomia candida]